MRLRVPHDVVRDTTGVARAAVERCALSVERVLADVQLGVDAQLEGGSSTAELDLSGLSAVGAAMLPDVRMVAHDSAERALQVCGLASRPSVADEAEQLAAAWAQVWLVALPSMLAPATLRGIRLWPHARKAASPPVEENPAFSPRRAAVVAQTEVSRAVGDGALLGARLAAREGVPVRKQWVVLAEACPVCVENARAGALELSALFPSGDVAPPAHPECRCGVRLVLSGSSA